MVYDHILLYTYNMCIIWITIRLVGAAEKTLIKLHGVIWPLRRGTYHRYHLPMYNNIIMCATFFAGLSLARRRSPGRLIQCARDTYHNSSRENRVSGRRDRCRGIQQESVIYIYYIHIPIHMQYGRRWVTADTAPRCVYPRVYIRAEDNRIAATAHDSGKVVGGAETQTDGRTD